MNTFNQQHTKLSIKLFSAAFLLSLLTFSLHVYSSNDTYSIQTIGGTLTLVGDDEHYVIADNMAVYFNDAKLFHADNPPVLHAYFSGYFDIDVAVIGMCANGGCLYRILEIHRHGKVSTSQEIGFARIERATITHDFNTIYLNDFEYPLTH